jgi:tetratricopeptide (TPR) repeat protein
MKNKIFFLIVFVMTLAPVFAQTAAKQDALVLYHNGKYREAVQVCEEELQDNPNRVESYVVMCWALVKNKQYAEAEERASEGLVISPYDLRLIEVLGEAKYYQGKNNEALEMFRTYIASAPSNAARIGNAYYYMGEIYIRQGKYQHADISMTTAVYTEPLVDIWWTRCGYAREMAGSYATALEAYSKALELKASNADAARGKERVTARLR